MAKKANPSQPTRKGGRRYRQMWGTHHPQWIKTHVISRYKGYIAYQFRFNGNLVTRVDHERSGRLIAFCPPSMAPRIMALTARLLDGRTRESKAKRVAPEGFIDRVHSFLGNARGVHPND